MVEKAAAHNDRSMNSEIIDRLYGSFQGPRGTDTVVLDPKQARVWADELRKFADHSIPLGKGVTIHLTIDDLEAAREEDGEGTKPNRTSRPPSPFR